MKDRKDKNNKSIITVIIGIAAFLVAIVIAFIIFNCLDDGEGTTVEETTIEASSDNEANEENDANNKGNSNEANSTDNENESVGLEDPESASSPDSTTNYWDNVEVVEDVNETETVTDANGETVTEAYPGEHSGWSPIVSPEDLE